MPVLRAEHVARLRVLQIDEGGQRLEHARELLEREGVDDVVGLADLVQHRARRLARLDGGNGRVAEKFLVPVTVGLVGEDQDRDREEVAVDGRDIVDDLFRAFRLGGDVDDQRIDLLRARADLLDHALGAVDVFKLVCIPDDGAQKLRPVVFGACQQQNGFHLHLPLLLPSE